MASTTVTTERYACQRRGHGETGGKGALLDRLDLVLAQKRALRATLAHKADSVGPEIGLNPRTLRSAFDEDTDAQLPFRRVPALLQASPDPMPLLEFWAGLVGAIVVKLPSPDNRPLYDAVREFADVMRADATALADDGRYSPEEVAEIVQEGRQAIAAIEGYLAHVRNVARSAA